MPRPLDPIQREAQGLLYYVLFSFPCGHSSDGGCSRYADPSIDVPIPANRSTMGHWRDLIHGGNFTLSLFHCTVLSNA